MRGYSPTRSKGIWTSLRGVAVAIVAAWGAHAAADALPPEGAINVSPHLAILRDLPEDARVDDLVHGAYDAAFRPVAAAEVNLGLTQSGAWFRLSLPAEAVGRPYVLELNNARLQRVTLYQPQANAAPRVKRMGTLEPVSEREFFRPAPTFRLAATSGADPALYFHVEHSGSLRFKALLWPESVFLRYMDRWTLGAFISFGAMLVLGLHSLGVYLSLRKAAYLYHGLMNMCMLLLNAALNGSGALYIWPGMPWWSMRAVSVFVFLTFASSVMFAVRFFRTHEHAPRLARITEGAALASLLAAGLSLTEWINRDYLTHSLGFILPLLVIVLSIEAARRKHRWVRNFFLAHSVVFAGLLIFVLLGLGWLPSNMFTEDILIYTYITAGLLWSFALSDQVRVLQQEAQARLERTVVDRTTALNQALSEVKTLQRLVPICSSCKKVRNDSGFWKAVEEFLSENTNARLTHHLCPDCAHDLFPEYLDESAPPPQAATKSD